MREAPSIVIIEELLRRGATVRAHDPEALETTRDILGDRIEYCTDPYKALDGATALLLVTEWNEYRRPDFDQIRNLLKEQVLFDGRNIWSADLIEKHDFEYYGIGMRGSRNVQK